MNTAFPLGDNPPPSDTMPDFEAFLVKPGGQELSMHYDLNSRYHLRRIFDKFDQREPLDLVHIATQIQIPYEDLLAFLTEYNQVFNRSLKHWSKETLENVPEEEKRRLIQYMEDNTRQDYSYAQFQMILSYPARFLQKIHTDFILRR